MPDGLRGTNGLGLRNEESQEVSMFMQKSELLLLRAKMFHKHLYSFAFKHFADVGCYPQGKFIS